MRYHFFEITHMPKLHY